MSDLHVLVDDAGGFWHSSGDTVVLDHAFHGGTSSGRRNWPIWSRGRRPPSSIDWSRS